MIKELTYSNLPQVRDLAVKFSKESYDAPVNSAKICLVLEQIISDKDMQGYVYEIDGKVVGMILGISNQLPFSLATTTVELAWYVLPEYRHTKAGLSLIKAYEEWSKRVADYSSMIHLGDTRLDNLYSKRGYERKEITYMKENK